MICMEEFGYESKFAAWQLQKIAWWVEVYDQLVEFCLHKMMQGVSVSSLAASANGGSCGALAMLRSDPRLLQKTQTNSLTDGPFLWHQCARTLFPTNSTRTRRMGARVKATWLFKGNGKEMDPNTERSESANEDILIFFFQLDLETRIQVLFPILFFCGGVVCSEYCFISVFWSIHSMSCGFGYKSNLGQPFHLFILILVWTLKCALWIVSTLFSSVSHLCQFNFVKLFPLGILQWQYALNMEQYDAAQQLRNKLAEVSNFPEAWSTFIIDGTLFFASEDYLNIAAFLSLERWKQK